MAWSLPAQSVSAGLQWNNLARDNLCDDVAPIGIDIAAAQATGQQHLTVLDQLRS
jgi:hypothetical protein